MGPFVEETLISLLNSLDTLVETTKTSGKAEHPESQKQRESPKMVRQRKNLQSKGMEELPVKKLNEMEASQLISKQKH